MRTIWYPIFLLGIGWFVVGIIPLLIFPLHHLATEQAFSLIGLGLIMGWIIHESWTAGYKHLSVISLCIYLLIAGNSIVMAKRTHWIVRSSQQAKRVLTYLSQKDPPDGTHIYFLDGDIKIAAYGSSKQLHEALGSGNGINLVLHKPHIISHYEYLDPHIKEKIKKEDIVIDSSKFLGY